MPKGTIFLTRFWSVALPAVLLGSLAAAGGAEPQTDSRKLAEAIVQASSEPSARAGMQLFAECLSDSAMRSLSVYGDGTGIWDNRRQFELTPEQLGSLLQALQEADFASMKEVYGGKEAGGDPKAPPKKPAADFVIQVTCRVEVTLGRLSKRVVQRVKGKQSQEFKKLANQLFEICRKPSRQGIEASGLNDGLSKLAGDQLKPQSWQLMMHRRPDERSALEGNIGFLLRIAGDTVTSRNFDPAAGYTDPLELHLSESDLQQLARRLAELDPDGLPVNLYARDYTDLNIRLLNHRKSVQARQFAGMTAAAHGQAQKNFDAIYEALYQLHLRVINEGKPAEKPSSE